MKRLLTIVLCLCVIFTFSFTAVTTAYGDDEQTDYMKDYVTQLSKVIDGEDAFDYLSYTYMGWRTTGGTWQNQVIANFVPEQLEKAGYVFNGKDACPSTEKSANDKSSDNTDDFAWVTYFNDVSSLTWNPEYAKLEVEIPEGIEGAEELKARIDVESYAFDPTTETYQQHYGELYDAKNPDEMWAWITAKDDDGKRINVENGKEAELNKRCHLAWQTCFTDPRGTDPAEAKGVEGEAVYVGTISGRAPNMKCSLVSDLTTLAGKAILSDSSLSNTWSFAQQVGGVAAMSTNSLSNYNLPMDENGEVIEPFKYSARYAQGGSLANTSKQTATGKPIVSWQFSVDQKAALKELLTKAGDKPIKIKSISIGDTYAMNDPDHGGLGQAVTIAEIKGASKPEERILICAHVQEPGSNDNATGVGCLTGMAINLKKAIDEGKIERPERTITFLWGDEMTMARLYLSSHKEECEKLVMSLDMDMTGEDPEKTGGHMRVEKSPDPSAKYLYTLDLLPWEDVEAYDETYTSTHPDNEPGEFVRVPDSHTLWGAGGFSNLFQEGYYLNDLYIDSGNSVTKYIDDGFEVDVCPYEGGSDHSVFLQAQIPALLTWHFTDYTYHSSVDTLNMSSAREMGNVNITTAATAFMTANAVDAKEGVAQNILKIVRDAAIDRISNVEKVNTDHHLIYASKPDKNPYDELVAEKEVLNAWGDWYKEAIRSVSKYLLEKPTRTFTSLENQYYNEIVAATDDAVNYANEIFIDSYSSEILAGLTDEVLDAQAAVEEAQEALAEAQNALEKDEAKIADLEKAAEQAQEALEAAQDALTTSEQKIAELEAAAKAAEENNAATQAALDEAKAAQEADAAAIAALKKEIKQLQINLAKTRTVTGLKLTQKSRKVTVKYTKAPGATAYQIQYKLSTAKKWTNLKKSFTKAKATTKALKKGKKYNFRVRAITKIEGKNYYGPWVKKSIKIKK